MKYISIVSLIFALFVYETTIAQNPDDIYWDTTIATAAGGLNGAVRAMTVYDGKLIVAGDFTTAGGITVNHIAAWDGESWSALGSGVDAWCQLLTVYNGGLIAGVNGGVIVWDASVWSPLGSGIEEVLPSVFHGTPPVALTVVNDTLYVAWSFTGIVSPEEGVSLIESHGVILSYDGTSWHHYADANEGVSRNGMAAYHGQLIFSPGENGYIWFLLGNTNGYSFGGGATIVWDDRLVRVTRHKTWTYSVVTSDVTVLAGDGIQDTVLAEGGSYAYEGIESLGIFNGRLILASVFGGQAIAQWDGTSLTSLGSGVEGRVHALVPYDSELVVGGDFLIAGGKSSPYIAQWITKFTCGDANGDNRLNVADAVFLINYLFKSGTPPEPIESADANCDAEANMDDIIYIINYIFKKGPRPVQPCQWK